MMESPYRKHINTKTFTIYTVKDVYRRPRHTSHGNISKQLVGVRACTREVIYPNGPNGESLEPNEDPVDPIYVYEVSVTYPSPEEQQDEDMYGFEYDDYDNY